MRERESIANIRYRHERGTTPRAEDVEVLLDELTSLTEAAYMIDLLCGPAPFEHRDKGEMEWWVKLREAMGVSNE